MKISERKLRSIIRQTLIKEGFFDSKKWRQFKKAVGHSAKKHGLSGGEMGEGLDYEGYLTYVFGEDSHVSELQSSIDSYLNHETSADRMMDDLYMISSKALCEYLGVIIQSVRANKMANLTFERLCQISVRQLASSDKYFRSGGLDQVLNMRKKDLEMEFNRSIPVVVKMSNV